MNVGMQCVPCYREGLIAHKGQKVTLDSPFAFAVLNGESVCLTHLASSMEDWKATP